MRAGKRMSYVRVCEGIEKGTEAKGELLRYGKAENSFERG